MNKKSNNSDNLESEYVLKMARTICMFFGYFNLFIGFLVVGVTLALGFRSFRIIDLISIFGVLINFAVGFFAFEKFDKKYKLIQSRVIEEIKWSR